MNERNFGLDLVRSSAILLVMFGHFFLFTKEPNNYLGYSLGFYGVELFFVLSGFLIGTIFIQECKKTEFTFRTVFEFWTKRWLRTLPLYYIVLLLHYCIDFTSTFKSLIPFLFFVQNFNFNTSSHWFGESWSLCVEEWFYLFLPLLVFLFRNNRLLVKHKTGILLFLISVFIVIRYVIYVKQYPDLAYDSTIRKFPLLRFDSLLVGVLFAYLNLNKNRLLSYIKLKITFISTLILFLTVVYIGNIYVYDFEHTKTVSSSIGFSFLSITFAVLIYFLYNFNFNIFPVVKKTTTWISKISYSLYLLHLPIYTFTTELFKDSISIFYQFSIALSFSFICAYFSYQLVEKQFLKLRNAIFDAR